MPTRWDQSAFRISADNGSETTATYLYALNTNGFRDWTAPFRLRFLVTETGTTAATLSPTLYYAVNGGGYTRVSATSSVVRPALSSYFADGAATTRTGNSRALGTGTFVAGSMDEVDGACSTTGTIAQNSETELEFCLQFRQADLIPGDQVSFRVRTGTSQFNAYTNTPTITVAQNVSGTAAASFSSSCGSTSSETMIATAILGAFLFLASATAKAVNTGTADLSPTFELASTGAVGSATSQGVRNLLAFWIGGGESGPIQGTANLTSTFAVNSASMEFASGFGSLTFPMSIHGEGMPLGGSRSMLAYWLGGASYNSEAVVPISANVALTYNPLIYATDQQGGVRSILAYWAGGASKGTGIGVSANLIFPPSISVVSQPVIHGTAGGNSITITWDANTESDLAGYKVYYRTDGSYTLIADVGNTVSYTFSLGVGTYQISVTAYNTPNEESAHSAEVEVSFGGLAYTSSMSASGTQQQINHANASLSFAPGMAANAAEILQITSADVAFLFAQGLSGNSFTEMNGTAGLSFSHATDATGTCTILPVTGTSGGLEFRPHINGTGTYGIRGTGALSYSFSAASTEKLRIHTSGALAFAQSEAASGRIGALGTAALAFTFSESGEATMMPRGTASLTFPFVISASGTVEVRGAFERTAYKLSLLGAMKTFDVGEVAYQASAIHNRAIAAGTVNYAVPMGGVSTASMIYITCDGPVTVKFDGTAGTAISLSSRRPLFMSGCSVTSIYISNSGTKSARVKAFIAGSA